MVHIGDAIGVDAGKQRHHVAQIRHVLPGDLQPGGGGDRHQMQRVVGRTTRCMEANQRVDDGLFRNDVPDRRIIIAFGGQRQSAPRRLAGQCVAQWRARIDEARAGQMQAHDLHQHLIGIGGAVEGTGAGRVIGFRFGFKQFGATDLALGIELADLALFVVRQPRGHRPGGNEHARQMAEAQSADQEAGHDLVADAQIDRGVEHVVAERDRGRHGDDVAREQRQVHAGLALGHAVAHRRHPACDLRGRAYGARRVLDDVGIELVGLMGAQHVVIRRDNAEVERPVAGQFRLVGGRAGSKAVGQVSATQRRPVDPVFLGARYAIKIDAARVGTACRDAIGHVLNSLEDRHRWSP